MNYNLVMLLMCLCIALSSAHSFVNAQEQSKSSKAEDSTRRCKVNPDTLYDRSSVLKEFADILNRSIPEYAQGISGGFYSDSERGRGFFIVDLTNPANKQLKWQDCVDFLNGHIYHVAPSDAHYSLSHIVILEDGRLKVFRSINCPARGDRLEDVINYVRARLSDDRKQQQVITRLRNFRKYGSYFALDHSAFICKHGKPVLQ